MVAGHLQLPHGGNGQRPDGQLDREAPCCDGGHDGNMCETGPRLGEIPVFGEGNAAEGGDEDGEDDPEYVADITGKDLERRVVRAVPISSLPETIGVEDLLARRKLLVMKIR